MGIFNNFINEPTTSLPVSVLPYMLDVIFTVPHKNIIIPGLLPSQSYVGESRREKRIEHTQREREEASSVA